MKVEILKDIFDKNSSHYDIKELNKLWNIIEDRHTLFLSDDDDIDALMESDWFEKQESITQEEIKELIINAIKEENTMKPHISISFLKENGYGVKEARKYLEQNFIILLENSDYDSYFIEAVLKNFPSKGKNIEEYFNEGYLEFGFGGGSSIKQVINRKLKSYNTEVFTKHLNSYLRYFVVIDSDKFYSDMSLDHKNEIIDYLKKNNVPYHILGKREMENYLPDEAFKTILLDFQEYVDTYLKLSPIQKDFFDVQKGFQHDYNKEEPPRKMKPKQKELWNKIKAFYDDLSEADKDLLFKKDLSKYNGNFKKEFPKLFNHPTVTKKTLLKRCEHHQGNSKDSHGPNELPNLIKRIEELL